MAFSQSNTSLDSIKNIRFLELTPPFEQQLKISLKKFSHAYENNYGTINKKYIDILSLLLLSIPLMLMTVSAIYPWLTGCYVITG